MNSFKDLAYFLRNFLPKIRMVRMERKSVITPSPCFSRSLNPLSANTTKWSNIQFVGKLPTNCLSVLDHFVKLVLKGLIARRRNETVCREIMFLWIVWYKNHKIRWRANIFSTKAGASTLSSLITRIVHGDFDGYLLNIKSIYLNLNIFWEAFIMVSS